MCVMSANWIVGGGLVLGQDETIRQRITEENRPCALVSYLMFRLDEIFLNTISITSNFSMTTVKLVLCIQNVHIIFPSYHILSLVREEFFMQKFKFGSKHLKINFLVTKINLMHFLYWSGFLGHLFQRYLYYIHL